MRNHFFPLAVLAAGTLALAGCGGGAKTALAPGAEVPGGHAYSSAARTRHSYTPYENGSRIFWYGDTIHVGGDVEPRENLRLISTEDGLRYYIGAVRDGIGVHRLEDYETDLQTQDGNDPYELQRHGFYPFRAAPRLVLDPDLRTAENEDIRRALWSSIYILNDVLPPEFQIQFDRYRAGDRAYYGEIVVSLETPESVAVNCGGGAVACASGSQSYSGYTNSSVVRIPDDVDTGGFSYARKVIVHELLHALGIWGHVDSIEFPDSIMGKAGDYLPNFGYILTQIDREVLQIMYMSQRTDLYNDWGEWSDTSFHLTVRSEDDMLNFGVSLFNGLPQPWAHGDKPDTTLADNSTLSGAATWTGALVAFSGPSPLAGDAELEVNLATLDDDDHEQDLRFRDIYFLNRIESEGEDRWFDTRDIDYKVRITGNFFRNVRDGDYEQGFVAGAFMGPEHEHMGGTVKRTDMVGAFGGSREVPD